MFNRENPHTYNPHSISFPDWHREPEPWVPLTGLVYYPVENPLSGRSFGRIQIFGLSEIPTVTSYSIVVEDHLYQPKSFCQNFSIKLGSSCSNENLAWAVHETIRFYNLTTVFIPHACHNPLTSRYLGGVAFVHTIF